MKSVVVAFAVLVSTGTAGANPTPTSDRLSKLIDQLASLEAAADKCGDVKTKLAELRRQMISLRDDVRGATNKEPLVGATTINETAFAALQKRVAGESAFDAKLRVL